MGYEPVRHETGAVPYGNDSAPEDYAYREVDLSDIVISIIGGRFGTGSHDDSGYSISQVELRRALDQGIQVYIFIEKSILAEFSTYRLNKETPGVKYQFVDDVRIYQFIEALYALPRNNPIAPFETSADIVKYLRVQWAGLFQRFLHDQMRLSELRVLEEMRDVSTTLKELTKFLTEERANKDEAIKSILLSNHPAFRRFADVTKTSYRVFFTNEKELNAWLEARGWKPTKTENLDDDSISEWNRANGYLKLRHHIFDDSGRLIAFTADEWDDTWIEFTKFEALTEDDVPF